MTTKEKAQAYVKSLDYIFPENREIAGKSYLAGYQAALESNEVRGLIEALQKFIKHEVDTLEYEPEIHKFNRYRENTYWIAVEALTQFKKARGLK